MEIETSLSLEAASAVLYWAVRSTCNLNNSCNWISCQKILKICQPSHSPHKPSYGDLSLWFVRETLQETSMQYFVWLKEENCYMTEVKSSIPDRPLHIRLRSYRQSIIFYINQEE